MSPSYDSTAITLSVTVGNYALLPGRTNNCSPAHDPARGPGPANGSTDNVRVWAGFGPSSNDSNKTKKEHFGLSRAIISHKEKVIRSCAHLMLVTQSGSGNKSHRLDFLGDFRSCPLPKIVRDNTLQTWHPISLYHSTNAKITSDVLRAPLNDSFMITGTNASKGTCINDTIVRADCKWIGLHSEKEFGLRWGTGNIFENKLRDWAKCSSSRVKF
jgi:hypothetical protein